MRLRLQGAEALKKLVLPVEGRNHHRNRRQFHHRFTPARVVAAQKYPRARSCNSALLAPFAAAPSERIAQRRRARAIRTTRKRNRRTAPLCFFRYTRKLS